MTSKPKTAIKQHLSIRRLFCYLFHRILQKHKSNNFCNTVFRKVDHTKYFPTPLIYYKQQYQPIRFCCYYLIIFRFTVCCPCSGYLSPKVDIKADRIDDSMSAYTFMLDLRPFVALSIE
jgi:hypothetical protein